MDPHFTLKVEPCTLVDINSKNLLSTPNEDFSHSIFRINDTDSVVVRNKLEAMLADPRIPRLAYSTLKVEAVKDFQFDTIELKFDAHLITLEVSYWQLAYLCLFASDPYKADSLLIEDFFKNTQDLEGQKEIVKASNQGQTILLMLSKPNNKGYQFLDCKLPGHPRKGVLFSVSSFWHNDLRYVFSSEFKGFKGLKHLRDISMLLMQYKNRGDKLVQAKKRSDVANKDYQKVRQTIDGPRAFVRTVEADQHQSHIAEKIQETVRVLFKSIGASQGELLLPYSWPIYTDTIDRQLGNIVDDLFKAIRLDRKKNRVTNDKPFREVKEKVRKQLNPPGKASALEKDFTVIFNLVKTSFEGLDSIQKEFEKLGLRLIPANMR